MDTIYIRLHGLVTSLKISELPPAIKTGGVLAKIEAAGINPSDVASVQDRFPGSVLPRMVARDLAVSVVDAPDEGFGAEVGELVAILVFRMMRRAAIHHNSAASSGAQNQTGSQRRKQRSRAFHFVTAYWALVRIDSARKGEEG